MHYLWKTLVEKSVENVENSMFSTGIFYSCLFRAAVEKSA